MGSGRMSITDVFNTDSLHTSVEFDGQGSATAGFRFTPKDGMTETT
ncbi:MAG: hypothetical protein R2795_03675 [Saprospiraceae bacterium]